MKTKNLFAVVTIAAIFIFAGTSRGAENLSDSQITELLKTANNAEIDAAKLAKTKAENKDVKKFADHMIKDHTANNKDTNKLEKKENLKEESSAQSQLILKDAGNQLTALKSTSRDFFDKAYMDQQVTMHQRLLTDLDQIFIPSAQNPELKLLLQSTRTHVQAHLEQAINIQGSLK